MSTTVIMEQVQTMTLSSFSEEERHRYQAEKMMLRQFLLMKQQDHLLDYLSVGDMKTWLLRGRSFLEEFQEIIEISGLHGLFMTELVWTTSRHLCLNQMQQELLEELEKEKRLSHLLSRKVTLEGLQMFLSVVHPAAEEVVQTLLPPLYSKLLQFFGGIMFTSDQLSAGHVKPVELLKLEQSTAPVVPEVVDTALKFLLEEPEWTNKSEAASTEIAKLLANSAFPCLAPFGSVSKTHVVRVCTLTARSIVAAIHETFNTRSKSFRMMHYDESCFSAQEGVICAIEGMDHQRQSAASQADLQLEDELLEKSEASPQVSVDEEVAGVKIHVTQDTCVARLETNVIVYIDDVLEVLQQEEVEVQNSLVQTFDKKKKKGARALFSGVWKKLTTCFCISTKQ